MTSDPATYAGHLDFVALVAAWLATCNGVGEMGRSALGQS